MVRLYFELSKAFLSALVLVTVVVGYVLGRGGVKLVNVELVDARLLWTFLGTGLAAAGANALNQWLERGVDARMERTRGRPLPAGKLSPRQALCWGFGAGGGGVILLALATNLLAAALALGVVLLYTLVYTPLKQRSTLCTLAGAVCGALPPVIGWVAATGRLELGAVWLGTTLFVWQIPHFFALAWMYRGDYARGGFRMLPVIDETGRVTFNAILLFCLILLPLGLTATLTGMTGLAFAVGSLLLGILWLVLGIRLWWDGSIISARNVFLASLVYLPLLLGLMVVDRAPPTGQGGWTGAEAVVVATEAGEDFGTAGRVELQAAVRDEARADHALAVTPQ